MRSMDDRVWASTDSAVNLASAHAITESAAFIVSPSADETRRGYYTRQRQLVAIVSI